MKIGNFINKIRTALRLKLNQEQSEMRIMRGSYFFYFILLCYTAKGQQVQFAADIGQVIYSNCTFCHHQGAVGPFALENYKDIKDHAKMITYVIEEGIMPPWKADRDYRSFHNDRKLDSGFLAVFTKWMTEGYPSGSGNTNFLSANAQKTSDKPDYVIRMPAPVKLTERNEDLFISFIDSINIPPDRYLKGVTIIPGNLRLLHHARVDFDTIDPGTKLMDERGFINMKNMDLLPQPAYGMVGNYVPGISRYTYPDGVGLKLKKKIYVTVNLHYAPNIKEDYDSTKVYIYLYPKGYKPREVTHLYVMFNPRGDSNAISKLPKNKITAVNISTYPTDTDISLISIQAHMHLVGKSIKIYAVTPGNDTVPLLRINNWDFNWQEIYYFNKPVILPKGSILTGEAVYDNTSANTSNPFYPPRDIYFNEGMKTTNEMFEFYLQSLIYQPGDENLDLYKQKNN